jgi:hypothetical protein
MTLRPLYLMAVAVSIGCATTAGQTGSAQRTASLLTAEEMAAAHADVLSAYDAVARLRPNWLVSHGAMTSNSAASEYATVFVDGQEVGDVNALKNIQAFQVGDIRYYNVTEAGAKFGVRAGTTGAIEVLMKGPNR